MLVAIIHNDVPPDAREDERDVLVQVDAVSQALDQLGHTSERIPVTLNLESLVDRLRRLAPDVVFNLVEALSGSDRFAGLAAAVVEQLGLPLTGSSSDPLWLSNYKTMAKRHLLTSQLLTPAWYEPGEEGTDEVGHLVGALQERTVSSADRLGSTSFIIKPQFEHASLGMDRESLVRPRDLCELGEQVRRRTEKLGQPCFAEQYIDGRELNVSLLAQERGCELLPLAEIDFSAFPPGQPRIVDYGAKWDPATFEYHHTPRRFLPRHSEPELHAELTRIARQCWREFPLGGYVRIDVRVDSEGRPWILEINTNPCLAPDAGFPGTLRHAGIEFPRAIARILEDAQRQCRHRSGTSVIPQSAGVVTRSDELPLTSGAPTRPASGSIQAAASAVPPSRSDAAEIRWRQDVRSEDPVRVRELVAATGFFYPDEVAVAEELVTERLLKGESSGYYFVFAELHGELVGYACYGEIACTRASYDLYWIAVHPKFQRIGAGKLILREAEEQIRRVGGKRVYIETSNRAQYLPTRGFYEKCGYFLEATLTDFYGPNDDKVIFVKAVG